MSGCDQCRALLSEGLDLCVRARDMDATFDQYVAGNNITRPHAPISTRSATMPLWFLDQYERDLADWEAKARRHLMQGCQCNV